MIEIRNIQKAYDREVVISHCTATIKDGSITGLIGVNGAGKSTLLRLLCGVLCPEEGLILYDGQPVYENAKVKQNIFFLPDDPFYGPSATSKTLESLYRNFYPAFTHEEFTKYLTLFGVLSQKSLSSFSKGMRRKVYISAAFSSHAETLLLDEVFDGLDPTSREIFKKCLIEFIAESPKHKVVIASHSLRELQDICDSFCLINAGQLEEGFSEASESGKLHKVRLAFAEPLAVSSLSELHILNSAADGRFLTLIVEGNEDEIRAKLNSFHPLVMDISSLSLEEAFIYKTGGSL
jgi:ABC-2 type transport system ATP-binding protein